MKIAMSPAAAPSVKLRPMAKQVPFLQWQDDLNYLEKEATFYLKLLKIGVNNCPENSKAAMHRLLTGFSSYLDTTIFELKSELASIDLENAEPPFVYRFQKKLENDFSRLRNLKESVFPQIHNMQRVSFW